MVYDPPHPSPRNKILARDSLLLVGLLGAIVVVLAVWAISMLF